MNFFLSRNARGLKSRWVHNPLRLSRQFTSLRIGDLEANNCMGESNATIAFGWCIFRVATNFRLFTQDRAEVACIDFHQTITGKHLLDGFHACE